jgi:hypothetical protein
MCSTLQVQRAKHLPGAGAYNQYSGVGKQPLSIKKSLPTFTFGRSTRDVAKKVRVQEPLHLCSCATEVVHLAAPLSISITSMPLHISLFQVHCDFAKLLVMLNHLASAHILPKARRLPFTFSHCWWLCLLFVQTFISKEHEKQSFGLTSPGPCTAQPYNSYGRQSLSTRSSSPGWGFGTSKVRHERV